jgi:nicotinate phosphoribosyltransferase
MGTTAKLYSQPLALLTDLYELTMSYGYWKLGMGRQEAVFHLYFRRQPFAGGYSIACGLEDVIEYLRQLHFGSEDLDYLASLTGSDDRPLFDRGFLDHLRDLKAISTPFLKARWYFPTSR